MNLKSFVPPNLESTKIANDNKAFPKREVFVCKCGCDRYELRPNGPYCYDCGQFAYSWVNS